MQATEAVIWVGWGQELGHRIKGLRPSKAGSLQHQLTVWLPGVPPEESDGRKRANGDRFLETLISNQWFQRLLDCYSRMFLTAGIFLKMQCPNLSGAFFLGLLFFSITSRGLQPGTGASGRNPILDQLTSKCCWFLLSKDIHWRNISFCSFLDLLPLRIESLSNLFGRHPSYMRTNHWSWKTEFVKRLQTLILPS